MPRLDDDDEPRAPSAAARRGTPSCAGRSRCRPRRLRRRAASVCQRVLCITSAVPPSARSHRRRNRRRRPSGCPSCGLPARTPPAPRASRARASGCPHGRGRSAASAATGPPPSPGSTASRVHLGPRLQDERALVGPRVRQLEVVRDGQHRAVHDDVDVERARPPALRRAPVRARSRSRWVTRSSSRGDSMVRAEDDRVEVVGLLVRSADRRGPGERRHLDDLQAGRVRRARRPRRAASPAAAPRFGAERQHDVDHGRRRDVQRVQHDLADDRVRARLDQTRTARRGRRLPRAGGSGHSLGSRRPRRVRSDASGPPLDSSPGGGENASTPGPWAHDLGPRDRAGSTAACAQRPARCAPTGGIARRDDGAARPGRTGGGGGQAARATAGHGRQDDAAAAVARARPARPAGAASSGGATGPDAAATPADDRAHRRTGSPGTTRSGSGAGAHRGRTRRTAVRGRYGSAAGSLARSRRMRTTTSPNGTSMGACGLCTRTSTACTTAVRPARSRRCARRRSRRGRRARPTSTADDLLARARRSARSARGRRRAAARRVSRCTTTSATNVWPSRRSSSKTPW